MVFRIGFAAALALGLCSTAAWADACSGPDHAGGTILGGLAGNAVAQDMDCADRPYAARSYNQSFRGPVGRRYGWNRGPNRGYIVTQREYRRDGQICRDFTQVVYRRGRQFDREGTACQRHDGEWELF